MIALVLLLTISSLASGQPDEMHLIIPGKGIGQVNIGMQDNAAASVLGPSKRYTIEDSPFLLWLWPTTAPNRELGFLVVYFYTGPGSISRGVVIAIEIQENESYATAEDIHIGSTAAEVRTAFGGPSSIKHRSSSGGDYDVMKYTSRGINIFVRQDRAFRILVCSPARVCEALDFF